MESRLNTIKALGELIKSLKVDRAELEHLLHISEVLTTTTPRNVVCPRCSAFIGTFVNMITGEAFCPACENDIVIKPEYR